MTPPAAGPAAGTRGGVGRTGRGGRTGRAGRGGRTARVVGQALAGRRYRWAGYVATAAYLLVFLAAIRDLTVSPVGIRRLVDPPAVTVVPNWTSRMFEQLALFHFEPVAAVYPTDRIEILVAPMNILTGLVLGGLVGLNMAVGW